MSVYPRPDRKQRPWCFKFRLKGELWRECGFKTKKEAQDAEAAARLRALTRQTHTAFLQAVTKRLAYLEAYTTRNHFRNNLTMLRRFAAWRDFFLEEITPEMIRTRLIELSQELGNHNANRHLRALRSVFELAVNDGDLPRNPCRGLRPFPVERAVKFVPTAGQFAQVLLLALPLDRAYLELLMDTGARVREINNLPWAEDVDLRQNDRIPFGQVRLWTRKKKGGHRTPRWVPLSGRGRKALLYPWEGRDKNSPWVFTNPRTGQAYDYRAKFFDRLCRLAGMPEMGFHALRHFWASELIAKGTPLDIIRDLAGHENISTTSWYLKGLGRGS